MSAGKYFSLYANLQLSSGRFKGNVFTYNYNWDETTDSYHWRWNSITFKFVDDFIVDAAVKALFVVRYNAEFGEPDPKTSWKRKKKLLYLLLYIILYEYLGNFVIFCQMDDF